MLSESDKYISNLFKVIRLGMVAPLANLMLFPIKLFIDLGVAGFTIYFFMSLIAFYIGFRFLDGGYDIINSSENIKK